MASKIRRQPDPAVMTVIATMAKEQSGKGFKRMFIFNLQSLSKLTEPPTLKYKENSYAVLEDPNALRVIMKMTDDCVTDSDVVSLAGRVFWGVSSCLDEEGPPAARRVNELGLVETVINVVNKGNLDEKAWTYYLDCVKNLSKAGIQVNPATMAPGLMSAFKPNKKLTESVALKVMQNLMIVAQSEGGGAILGNLGAADKVLSCALQYEVSPSSTELATAACFVVRQAALERSANSSSVVDNIISVIEKYKGKKIVSDTGSSALAAVVGPAQMKACIDSLKSAAPGSQERSDALITLSSMSYIGTYAEAVVKAGGIPVLCDAARQASKDLAGGSKDEKILKGLCGACKMLRKVAETQANCEAIRAANGIEALSGLLTACSNNAQVAAWCCEALAPLALMPECAIEIEKQKAFQVAIQALSSCPSTTAGNDFIKGAAALLSSGAHPVTADVLLQIGAVEGFRLMMSRPVADKDRDPLFERDCLVGLAALSAAAQDPAAFLPVNPLVAESIQRNIQNSTTVQHGIKYFENLTKAKDISSLIGSTPVVDAALAVMLEHEHSKDLFSAAKSILELVATPEDVSRALKDLDRVVTSSNADSKQCYRALAAVNGLSQIPRLRSAFEQKDATKSIIKGITVWLEKPKLIDQQKLTRAAVTCVENLATTSPNSVGGPIHQLLELAALACMKGVQERQDANSNNLLDVAEAVTKLCQMNRVSNLEEVKTLVEEIQNVMRKYPDSRKVNAACIRALTGLVGSFPPKSAELMMTCGAAKSVVSYIMKVAVYEDVQAAGFAFLHTVLKTDPASVERMRNTEAFEACKIANRNHPRSAEVRKYLMPVSALLTPEDEIEKVINESIMKIQQGGKTGDIRTCTDALRKMNQVVYAPEAARVAVKCRVGQALFTLSDQMKKMEKANASDIEDAYAELALATKNITQTKLGAQHIAKTTGISNVLGYFENLANKAGRGDASEAALRASRAILRADRESTDIAYQRGAVAKICVFADQNDDKEELFGAAAAALGAFQNKKRMLKDPEFVKFLNKMEKGLNSADKPTRLRMLEALEEFIRDPDEQVIEVLVNHKMPHALLKIIDDFPEDLPTVKRAQRCLDSINEVKNLRGVFSKDGPKQLEVVVQVNKRVIGTARLDPDCCAGSLRMVNACTNKTDRALLQSTGIIAEVEALLEMYPEHADLMKQCGKLLGNLGADELIRDLMKQIIAECNANPKNPRHLMMLNNKLGVYLAGSVDNPARAMEYSKPCMDALADVALKNEDNAPLLESICKVARRVADKQPTDTTPTFGPRSLQTKMMPTLTELMAKNATDPTKRTKKAIVDGLAALGACAKDPATRQPAINEAMKRNLIPSCQELLKVYENDPEVTAAILEYFTDFSSSPEGAASLTAVYKPNKRNIAADLVTDTAAIMNRHRMTSTVVAAGMNLLAALAANSKNIPPQLSDPAFLGQLHEMADGSPESLTAEMNVVKNLMGKLPPEVAAALYQKALDTNTGVQNDDSLSAEDKAMVGGALADLTDKMATEGLTSEIKKAGGLQSLIDLFELGRSNDEVMMRTCRALKDMARLDADMAAKITREGLKIMLGEGLPDLSTNPELAHEVLDLLCAVCAHEGNGTCLSNTVGLKEAFEQISMLAADLPGKEGDEMRTLLEQTKKKIDDDNPEVLTLKQVFERWSGKKKEGENLICGENTSVIQQIDFVFDYTEEYSKEPHKNVKTELGSEFMYGCKCFGLLHEHETNTGVCVERGEALFMLKAIARQKEDLVAQFPIVAANAAVQYPPAAEKWAATPNASAIAADALVRGRKMKQPNEELETILIPRMELVERLAITRTYFNGTDAMGALIGIWDDYDDGKFSTILLRQVFRSMRKIVNDHWVDIILKNKVPRRLIDVVNDLKVDVLVLPDVLFLLGTLAVVPQIKDLIGELEGVEACLELLKRQLKTPSENSSAVQTNACLALANMTIAHAPNTARFAQRKGLELNITVMEASMTGKLDYDVANGASILMCNTCFKRDDMKELYGQKGGCQAIMKTIQRYDGSEDIKAFRCLGAMFKAIGNLALFVPNVQKFLDLGIEKTVADLYLKSEKLPDNLIETSFRTVSNLVMENTDANMLKFGILLSPILNMIKQDQRSSTTMFALGFDVLGCLCRHPTNSRKFLEQQGIPVVLKILNTYTDVPLYSYGIYVLGIQTSVPEAIPELIKHGIFPFLTSLLETQVNAEEINFDLTVSGLRCIRRLLKNEKVATECVKSRVIPQMVNLMKRGDDHSMVHMECYRNMICLLTLFPPPPAPPPKPKAQKVIDEWEAEVADEGVLPAVLCLDRPPSPRSWEKLQLDAPLVSQIVESTCPLLRKEGNEKNLRLVKAALGLLAYFACEKIPGTNQAFYAGNIGETLEHVFNNFDGEGDIIKTGCYILNNVAYASEAELYLQLRREREMRRSLDNAIRNIGKASGSDARDFCTMTLKLLNEKSADPLRFEMHMQWDYPLSMTEWDKDKYPNGVQDLPQEMRDELRTGGKLKVQLNDREKEVLFWKSSMDMSMLQWRVDPRDGPFQHAIATSRIRCIAKGLASNVLQSANANGSATSKPKAGDCMVLQGPPSDEFPTGMELNIVFNTHKSRDAFYELMTEWRDAATYGF